VPPLPPAPLPKRNPAERAPESSLRRDSQNPTTSGELQAPGTAPATRSEALVQHGQYCTNYQIYNLVLRISRWARYRLWGKSHRGHIRTWEWT